MSKNSKSAELTVDNIVDELFGSEEDTGVEETKTVFETADENGEKETKSEEEKTTLNNSDSEDDKSEDDASKENKEEDAAKTEESKKSEEKVEDDELTKLEKRRRDTESELTKERQARLDLEKRLKAIEEKGSKETLDKETQKREQEAVAAKDEAISKFKSQYLEKVKEGDTEAVVDAFTDLLQKIHSVQNSPTATNQSRVMEEYVKTPEGKAQVLRIVEAARLEQEVEVIKEKYDDYDDVIQKFVPAVNADPKLNKTWISKGKTAEAAYELGKELIEKEKIIADPDAWREAEREKIKQELAKETKQDKVAGSGVPKTLANRNGSTSTKPKAELQDVEGVFDSLGY